MHTTGKLTKTHDAPDAATSVGWVTAQRMQLATVGEPFELINGKTLGPLEVEYEMYGALNAERSNVILVTHALSGDAHAAGWDQQAERDGRGWRARKPGWWDAMIGPGKHIDTNRWCVICSNVLGSCYGSTGPASMDPATGRAYGLSFPMVTVEDWVRVQALLIDALGIKQLHAVVGGSLGGQQALEWALRYPDRLKRCIVLAAAPRLSAQGLGFNTVARHAIMTDRHFADGDYYERNDPADGLAAARMLAHITYLSEQGMHTKFGRRLRNKEKPDFDFGIEFEVESYLDYQGKSFVERFDANSYLYITRAMDYYDAAETWGKGDLLTACQRIQADTMVVSFSSDWLYTPQQSHELAATLCRAGASVTAAELPSPYGHDAFLLEVPTLGPMLQNFLLKGHGDTGVGGAT